MYFPKTFQKCLFNQWSVNSPSKYCSLIFGRVSRTHVAPSLLEFCEYEHPVWRCRGGPPTFSAVGGFDTLQCISRVISIHSNGSVLFFVLLQRWQTEHKREDFIMDFKILSGFLIQFNFIYISPNHNNSRLRASPHMAKKMSGGGPVCKHICACVFFTL